MNLFRFGATAWGQRWAAWSRPQRDAVFLLAVCGWVLLPHGLRLPLWEQIFFLAVFLWRAGVAFRGWHLPGGRYTLTALFVLAFPLSFFSYGTLMDFKAGVALGLALLGLKILETRRVGDLHAIFFLGFFAVLTNLLYSQSLLTALLAASAILALFALQIWGHMAGAGASLSAAWGAALRMALLGVPLMAALFIFFPRITSPLWAFGREGESTSESGMAEQMAPGSIARLALSERIALRARLLHSSVPLHEADWYWRGVVFSNFDGQRWLPERPLWHEPTLITMRAEQEALQSLPLTGARGVVEMEITLEPTRLPWPVTLDIPASSPTSAQNSAPALQADLQWVLSKPLSERSRYRVRAYLAQGWGQGAALFGNAAMLERARALPSDGNEETRRWAAAWLVREHLQGADATRIANALLQTLQRDTFRYSLTPGAYADADNAIDEFWMRRKEGFCEHFASAFAFILRSLGIPARIVTGFQGAERNVLDDTVVVRNSHAHAWVEYWQEGEGWRRADPTSAVAPDRIEQGATLAPPLRGAAGRALAAPEARRWFKRIRWVWEALDNAWTQAVLNYSEERQSDLLKNLGIKAQTRRDLWRVLGIALGGALLLAALLSVLGTGGMFIRRRDPWSALWRHTLRQCERMGIALATPTPRTLAQALTQRFGALAANWGEWLLRLEALRYAKPAGANPSGFAQPVLKTAITQLRRERPELLPRDAMGA